MITDRALKPFHPAFDLAFTDLVATEWGQNCVKILGLSNYLSKFMQI